jgi:hypothetical protein
MQFSVSVSARSSKFGISSARCRLTIQPGVAVTLSVDAEGAVATPLPDAAAPGAFNSLLANLTGMLSLDEFVGVAAEVGANLHPYHPQTLTRNRAGSLPSPLSTPHTI